MSPQASCSYRWGFWEVIGSWELIADVLLAWESGQKRWVTRSVTRETFSLPCFSFLSQQGFLESLIRATLLHQISPSVFRLIY